MPGWMPRVYGYDPGSPSRSSSPGATSSASYRRSISIPESVKRGQGLVVVEAMKMENELAAPRDGLVKKILVAEGQPVERGAVLVELE